MITFMPVNNPLRVSHDCLLRMASEEVPGSWLAQDKWDGWRHQAYKDGGRWLHFSKGSGEQAKRMPPGWLLKQLYDLFADQDNIALDLEWMGPRCKDEIRIIHGPDWNGFVLIDLIWLNGTWLGHVPYSQRWANLGTIVSLAQQKAPAPNISVVRTVTEGWDKLFEESKKNPLLEGIVLKRANSLLIHGDKNPLWRKVKWREIREACIL